MRVAARRRFIELTLRGAAAATPRARTAAVAAAVLISLAVPNVVFILTHATVHLADNDVRLYYSAAKLGQAHGWSALYAEGLQRQTLFATTPSQAFLPFVNPPWAAWAVAFVAWLPYDVVYGMAVVAGFAAVLSASQLIGWRTWPERVAAAASVLALQPAVIGGYYANAVVVIPLILVLTWRLLKTDRQILAGIVLSAASVKPHLVVLVPVALLLAGYWRAVLACTASLSVLGAAALLTLGAQGVRQYLDLLRSTSGRSNQQVTTLAHLLGGGDLAWIATAIVVAAVAAVALIHRRRDLETVLAVGVLGSMLVDRYLNGLDWTVPLVAAWLLLSGRAPALIAASVGALWISADFVSQVPALAPAAAAVALLAVAGTALRPPGPQPLAEHMPKEIAGRPAA